MQKTTSVGTRVPPLHCNTDSLKGLNVNIISVSTLPATALVGGKLVRPRNHE